MMLPLRTAVLGPPASPCPARHRARQRRSLLCAAALPPEVLGASYTPPPLELETWQLYVGAFAGFFPFGVVRRLCCGDMRVLHELSLSASSFQATYEFGKRILIQRQCALCGGSGLIQRTQWGERRKLKCTACGGFLPWESWSLFLTSDVGNGGKLRFPKGQTSVLFDVDAARAESERIASLGEAEAVEEDSEQ